MTLEKGSKIYDDWVENPVTTYFQVWVFDIQNPEEVIERGDKPFLAERGPYTYRYHIFLNELKSCCFTVFATLDQSSTEMLRFKV